MKRNLKEFGLHPFEVCSAIYFLLIGLSLILSGFNVAISKIQILPTPLVAAWAFSLVLGGPAMVVGVMWSGRQFIAHAIERAGLYLVASAWITYLVTLLSVSHDPVQLFIPLGQSIVFAVTCLIRAHVLSKVDRVVEHIAKVARNSEES